MADEIVKVVDMPFGKRPFRIHYDPTEDGANVGFTVLDRLRAEMLYRVGLSDLLKPSVLVEARRIPAHLNPTKKDIRHDFHHAFPLVR